MLRLSNAQQDSTENLVEKLPKHFSKIQINRAFREASGVVRWMVNFGHFLVTFSFRTHPIINDDNLGRAG